jgi:exopolyphosphatase/guanosine-5'-triphosphate,3'-diphosphate pyrophosphatase
MINNGNKRSHKESGHIASIDIGSHTARLLIARETASEDLFKPIIRKRAYISLAESLDKHSRDKISPEAIKRSLKVLDDFIHTVKKYNADVILAVATGVIRRAANRKSFLDLIRKKTGINAALISGVSEARLTLKGVTHFLDLSGEASVVFDLGGGTTEFIYGRDESVDIRSLPLGAAMLTQDFLEADPPADYQIEILSRHIDRVLKGGLPGNRGDTTIVIGSGGTVTTIASMVYRIDLPDITPDRLNGLNLKRKVIEELFSRIRYLPIAERQRLRGLDKGRAGVILAGTVTLIRILYFLNTTDITVSYSDILEGIIISYLQGEAYE